MVRPVFGANAVRDVELEIIHVLGDMMGTLKSKRSEDKKARYLEMQQQEKSQKDVSSVYDSQIKLSTILGIFRGVFSFASAGSTLLGPLGVAAFRGVDLSQLAEGLPRDQEKALQEQITSMITGLLDASAKTSESASGVITTLKDAERYIPQTAADRARTGYDDFTRKMEEALQSGQSIEQFLEKYIEAIKEKERHRNQLMSR